MNSKEEISVQNRFSTAYEMPQRVTEMKLQRFDLVIIMNVHVSNFLSPKKIFCLPVSEHDNSNMKKPRKMKFGTWSLHQNRRFLKSNLGWNPSTETVFRTVLVHVSTSTEKRNEQDV
ncbi:hypothetical protein AVEN_218807-1 [Araneus ventricosus]|uniref:Uncharacterized protein n=1 Tax=Araneus ventricosus TaxID=182803 RepID=A0A4Y2B505_ARAVE|nr:hypothetical protein AVEN_218807-1 [Araneus ventricosus]